MLAAKRHAELLAAVVTTSEFLLKSPSLTDAIGEVLVQMGTALQADRCMLGVYLPPDTNDAFGYVDFQHEWVAHGIARQTEKPGLKVFAMSKYQEFIKPLLEGLAVPVMTEAIENQEAIKEQELTGAQSQFVYPIMVDGKLWGIFDVDDCRSPRIWSPTEIDSMRLVASALSSVIKREQLVEARIAAERERESAKQAGEIAVTNERNRIARDIHDTLAQGFTGVIMQSQAAEDALQKQDTPAALHHMARGQHIAKTSLRDARRSVFALRPSVLVDQTLAQALQAQLERMAVDSIVQASMVTTGEPVEPSNLVATELLRIAQEATNNVLRHADASQIKLCLHWYSGVVELTVQDNGCGFDVKQDHPGFGMISMRERADRMQGVLRVESGLGQGTMLSIKVDPHAGESVEKSVALKLTT